MRWWIAVGATLWLVVAPGTSRAGTHEDVERAARMIATFDYAGAVRLLGGLRDAPDATPADRVRAFELLAVAYYLMERPRDATREAGTLFDLDPGHRLSDEQYPPRMVQFFERVRRSRRPVARATLELDVTGLPRIRARADDPRSMVDGVVLYHRRTGETLYRTLTLERQGPAWVGTLPYAGTGVDLYVEALAPSGARLGSFHSAQDPLSATIPRPVLVTAPVVGAVAPGALQRVPPPGATVETRSSSGSTWLWIAVGSAVLLAGGGVAAAVLIERPARDGTLGDRPFPP